MARRNKYQIEQTLEHTKNMTKGTKTGDTLNLLPKQAATKASEAARNARYRAYPASQGYMPPIKEGLGYMKTAIGKAARGIAKGAGQNINAMTMIDNPEIMGNFLKGKKGNRGPRA